MRAISAAFMIGLAMGTVAPALGGAPVVVAASPDVATIAKEVRETIASHRALSMSAATTPVGIEKGVAYEAQYTAMRADAGGWKLASTGGVKGQSKGAAGSWNIGCDGVSARARRDDEQAVYEADAWKIDELRAFFATQNAADPIAWELLMDPPCPGLETGTHEGTQKVDGVSCDVILVPGVNIVGAGSTRYYIATTDRLPRRIERIQPASADADDAKEKPEKQEKKEKKAEKDSAAPLTRLTLSDLRTDQAVTPAVFTMTVPQGYRVRAVRLQQPNQRQAAKPKAAEPPAPKGLLANGSDAPDFTLTSADGEEITLSKLRGKVVILDFWATWCPPCRKAMPEMQKLHEEFANLPVRVYGVNCWERGDPKKYMADNDLDYGLLLKGDNVARDYKVEGIPTFYVIGTDGKVLMTQVGFMPGTDEKIRKAIREHLVQ